MDGRKNMLNQGVNSKNIDFSVVLRHEHHFIPRIDNQLHIMTLNKFMRKL